MVCGIPQLLHVSIHGRLGCTHDLLVVVIAAMNIEVQICF